VIPTIVTFNDKCYIEVLVTARGEQITGKDMQYRRTMLSIVRKKRRKEL
jgi:hypothetical protein